MVICKCDNLPSAKCYKETQFSKVKRRGSEERVPFLGLDEGIHTVKFQTDNKSIIRKVRVYYNSMFGWAWFILK